MNEHELQLEFTNLLSSIKLPDGIKQLILAKAFSDHKLYVTLPLELSKLYKNDETDKSKIYKLSFYSYLYFCSVLAFDKYYDGQSDQRLKSILPTLIFSVKEASLLGLVSLFGVESEFWIKFNELKSIFFKYSKVKAEIQVETDDDYFEYAKGKSILIHSYVYALKYLFGPLEKEDEIIKALDLYSIGFQIYDDYKDIREDLKNEQLNYFIFHIEKYDKPDEYQIKRMFLQNDVCEHFDKSLYFLNKSSEMFSNIGINNLSNSSDEIIFLIRSELHFIQMTIQKAREKSTKSKIIVKENNLAKAKDNALLFLKNNLKDNFWEDFATNAGYGREWITGYVLCMLGEIDVKIPFLDKPKIELFQSKGSYNNGIVNDADSYNFLMKSLVLFNDSSYHIRLPEWFNFSNEEGGWATYSDCDGIRQCMRMPEDTDFTAWLNPQMCVTGVAAWVLKDVKECRGLYLKTIEYIIKNQYDEGYWKSYWWTENLYATAFCILALPKQSKYVEIIEYGIEYIVGKQHPEGYWMNLDKRSFFYTALCLKTLIDWYLYSGRIDLKSSIELGIRWLIENQMQDGSWLSNRILRIPFPNILSPEKEIFRNTSWGLNCISDDHNRVFTTATVYNAISLYGKYM